MPQTKWDYFKIQESFVVICFVPDLGKWTTAGYLLLLLAAVVQISSAGCGWSSRLCAGGVEGGSCGSCRSSGSVSSHFTTTVSKSELLTCAQSVRGLFRVLLGGIQFLSIFTHDQGSVEIQVSPGSSCVCYVSPQAEQPPQLCVSAHAAVPDPWDKWSRNPFPVPSWKEPGL